MTWGIYSLERCQQLPQLRAEWRESIEGSGEGEGRERPPPLFYPPVASQLICTLCSSVPLFKELCGTKTIASPRRCALEFCFCQFQVNLDLQPQCSSVKEAVVNLQNKVQSLFSLPSFSLSPQSLRSYETSLLPATSATPPPLKLGHPHHHPPELCRSAFFQVPQTSSHNNACFGFRLQHL